VNTQPYETQNTPPPSNTHVSVIRDRNWLVLQIERRRATRRVYLLPDEAAMVVAALQTELRRDGR
jgi:hypothetical protein